jgi:ubiquinone/menaquinone biosynthesis C-methylase UbiE
MNRFRGWLVAQFEKPHGVAGQLAGRVMAMRPSNRLRNSETIRLLDIKPTDMVVEIGCGPGLGVVAARQLADEGLVIGIDHSPLMLKQARMRLQKYRISTGVGFIGGDADTAVTLAPAANCIFSVNVAQFIPDRPDLIARLARGLRPKGRLAFTYQPRGGNPTQQAGIKMADALVAEMQTAGLVARKIEIPLKPVSAWCAIGEKKRPAI